MPKTIYIDNTELTRDKRVTYLTEDVVSTGSTIRVQSILGFNSVDTSSGQILIIGKLGNERTEILRSSNSTNPSQNYKEVTLRDTMVFDHPQDTPVYITDWNRVEVQWASTASGSKSTLFAYPFSVQPDRLETDVRETTKSSGFYFTRFNETIGNTNSDWSDPVPYAGYDDNMVFAIKQGAMNMIGESIDGKIITHDYLNESLWEGRREYHQAPGKRPFRRKFNVSIGAALTGSFRIDLPTDVERPWTAENVYGVRIGTENNMKYVDKKEFDFFYRGVPHSTLDVPYTKGVSTSIWLANGRDFSSSATINVEGTYVGLTKITGSNNSFTVVTHGQWDASAGSDAWQNASFGLPDKFTVFAEPGGSAHIYFNRPIDTAYVNQNIFLDYYRTLLGFDSDADVLDEPNYDMYKYLLAAKIKHRKNIGESDIVQDPNYKLWILKKGEALSREVLSTDINISPDIDHLPLPE